MIAAPLLALAGLMTSPAYGETATYIQPSLIDDASLGALSTQGDGGGYLIALGETLSLLFDSPIGTNRNSSISIFTLDPPQGVARAQIRIGNYNNGTPTFLNFHNFRAGRTVNNAGLLNGCQLLGGCDYIEIATTRTTRGAAGVEVDYLLVDGQVVQVASPTPEPKTWALMIIAFACVAGRMKAMRRENTSKNVLKRLLPAAGQSDPYNRLWPETKAPQTGHL